jgi:hypothetical protein
MAGGILELFHFHHKRVSVAVEEHFLYHLAAAGGLAFHHILPRAAIDMDKAGFQAFFQSFSIHVNKSQHFSGVDLLKNNRY